MNTKEARRIIINELERLGLSHVTVKARNISFSDLGREQYVFVELIGGLNPEEYHAINELAHKSGFCIET